MRNFISEDDIEQSIIEVFKNKLQYSYVNCFTANPDDLNDRSNRRNKADVVLEDILYKKLLELNPSIPEVAINQALKELVRVRAAMSDMFANKEVYYLAKDGVLVTYQDERGRDTQDRVKVINFNDPDKNDFTIVSQLWIKGTVCYRRPDVILYINGLPLVFIELKNSNIQLQNAYKDNLTNYRKDIPVLFNYNALTIFSNGLETKIGSFNSEWEHFSDWLRLESEKEIIDKEQIREAKVSLEHTVLRLCEKKNLLDYIENFILFQKDGYFKVTAKNHQFLGVNNAIRSFTERETRNGKLGVFWHTQGSGKSFSMVMFAKKIFRKFEGNFTFLIVTDRDDLDKQIYKNFLYMEAVKKGEESRPKNSEELRDFLKTNKRFIFTLIQKFRYPKGKQYPILSERSEIIVIVDEAHRTQYADLAENMRAGLPNAQFIAFTGTPLLGKEKKTNAWFGEYVSEYNFAQSIEDGATVPLFYDKRVPEVQIQNDTLNEELAEILEDENLTDEQREKVERDFSQEIEVIKRDDRLETIARDIAYHFPRRGYKGKGMVISVDKFTAVKMYDKVSKYWQEEIKSLRREIASTRNEDEKLELNKTLQYMKFVEIAVVISEEAGENEKFEKQGLNIIPHRKRIVKLDENGQDIESNFKNPEHPLQLVFVCSMWLTGFDAPTVSTLYLDKPMKNHTLMQTIARANRVAPGKVNGLIVDYYNVFRNIKRALADYGNGEGAAPDQNPEGQDPVQDKEKLYFLLDNAITDALAFCKNLNIDLTLISGSEEVFRNLEYFQEFRDKLEEKDDYKKQFIVYDNTIEALYEACKPDILKDKREYKIVSVFQYLRGIIDVNAQRGDLDSAKLRISELLDESIMARNDGYSTTEEKKKYEIKAGNLLDLSKMDFDKLRIEFKQAKYKHIEISDLRAFIEDKLQKMLNKNVNRVDFLQKLQDIVDRYNSGGMITENYFEDLLKFAEDLKEEDKRHIKEGLTEAELEIFDLLYKDKLTEKEKQSVKLAAKDLLKRLLEEQPKVLVQDWHKDTQTRLKVESVIMDVLDKDLPDSYDRIVFNEKCKKIFEHFFFLASKGRPEAA